MIGNIFFVMGELIMILILAILLVKYGLIPTPEAEHKRPKDQPREIARGGNSRGRHRAPHIHREA